MWLYAIFFFSSYNSVETEFGDLLAQVEKGLLFFSLYLWHSIEYFYTFKVTETSPLWFPSNRPLMPLWENRPTIADKHYHKTKIFSVMRSEKKKQNSCILLWDTLAIMTNGSQMSIV